MIETTTNPFTINLVETSYHRRQCSVCGGWTGKNLIVAENPRDASPRIRVCETCLEAGDFDDRLADHAEALEALAIETRALMGLLKVPTFAEWKTANEEAEADYKKSYYDDLPPTSDLPAPVPPDVGDELPF